MLSVCNDIFYSLSYQLILSGALWYFMLASFSGGFLSKLVYLWLKDFPRKVMSLCTNSTSAFLEHLSNRKKMSFERSKIQNLSSSAHILPTNSTLLRCEIIPDSPMMNLWRQVKRIC